MGKPSSFPTRWAIHPDALPDLRASWESAHAAAWSKDDRAVALADMRQTAAPASAGGGSIAIMEIAGPLAKRGSWFNPIGMADIERALGELVAMPDVAAIVMSIDSPGGTVDGTERLAQAVARANEAKPVISFADGMMASAAYWIGSQAERIVASPLSIVGSIGTVAFHADYSVMLERDGIKITVLRAEQSTEKAQGNPVEPLSDEAKAKIVAELTTMNLAFMAGVSAKRPALTAADMTGQWWTAENAPKGMIDIIGSLEDAVALAARIATERRSTAQADYLTRRRMGMMETIKSVRQAFAGNTFLPEALGLAADGKSEAEIFRAYSTALEAKITAIESDHAKQVETDRAAHAAALAAEQAKTKGAEDRADKAEAKLASAGFTPAEKGAGAGAARGNVKVIRVL